MIQDWGLICEEEIGAAFESAAEVQTNVSATTRPVDVQLVPEEAFRVIVENTADIQTNEMATSSSVDAELMCEEVIRVIIENTADVQTDEMTTSGCVGVAQQVESINTGTGPILFETIDFSDGVTGTILQKFPSSQSSNIFKYSAQNHHLYFHITGTICIHFPGSICQWIRLCQKNIWSRLSLQPHCMSSR